MSDTLDDDDVPSEFRRVVNMPAQALEDWLATEKSRSVGWTRDGESEAVGHQSGRRIVEILRRKPTEITDEDLSQMRRVISYCRRHLAQRPAGDITETRWRYSLMNWGHDPLKD